MSKVYIIEDDQKIREELSIFLRKNGYEVASLTTFENPIETILDANPDIILLDINLPNSDGYYLCKQMRKHSNIPIIIVTSRNTQMDELMSMNLGADDFVTKPYHTQILLARIEAILKRTSGDYARNSVIEYRGLKVDITKSNMTAKNMTMELTKNEIKILSYLLQKKGTIVPRDELMCYLWDSEMFVDDNTLTVNINRLRKKIEEVAQDSFIETRRGQGYMIE